MSDIDKNLSQVLGTEDFIPVIPATTQQHQPITIHQEDPGETKKYDADYSRANYYNLIEKGNEAIDGILNVARESQHPRAYEVAATLIKNMSDVTEKLMILQKQQRDLVPKEEQQQTNINVEQAVFVGSTADLLKKVKNETNSQQS
jgi:hypothetical protein